MNHLNKEPEYSNINATKEQVKAAIRAAKFIMQRPLPLTHAAAKIALVGYQEEESGQYKLLKEFRIFQTGELFKDHTELEGHTRLIALPFMTREEYELAQSEEIPDYRVYEEFATDENQG